MARKRQHISRVIEEEEEEEEEGEEEEQPASSSSNGDDDDDEEDLEGDEDEEEKPADEEEEDLSNKESIRKLLEPFGKDQLVDILKEASLKHPSLLSRVLSASLSDPVHRNIFVHGLGWDATPETLSAVFSPFGKIEQCKVISGGPAGRCKGYGFVLFRSRAAAQRALKDPQKKIGNRIASCQLASLGRPGFAGQGSSEAATGRKIFVNNVGNNINPERLRAFFSKFGEIEQGPLGYDPLTGKLRGFAIFVYKTVEGSKKALEEPKKYFDGCELHCREAVEGPNKNNYTEMTPVAGTQTVPAALQVNDLALSYASAGSLMGHNLGAGPAALIGHSGGFGLLNPAGGLSPAFSRGGAGTLPQPYGAGSANRVSGLGVNTISPSAIGSYGPLAALHGLGAYQNSQSAAVVRPQSGIGSLGTSGLPPFFRQ